MATALIVFLREFVASDKKWRLEGRRRIAGVPTVFFHVPKCAGTAFANGLGNALRPSSILSGFDHCLFGSFRQFETASAEASASVYGPDQPLPAAADLVAGHFALSTVRRFYPQANYCTVMREPMSRLLSHWLFWRQQTDAEMAPWGPEWGERSRRARLPLVDFLRAPDVACQTDNLAVRMLLWPDRRIPAGGFIEPGQDRAILRSALTALRRFDFVDFLENPDFAQNVGGWIGGSFELKRLNETRRAPQEFPVDLEREMTAEAYALLEERTRLDFRLWEAVVEYQRPQEDVRSLRTTTLRSNIDHHKRVQRNG